MQNRFGLLVTDVMPIFMIIALDIVITLRFSINCSTVIRSSTVIFSILREAFPLFINGFVITYVYNEAKIDIDLLLSKGLFSNGIQRDFNVLFMPVFVLSLYIMSSCLRCYSIFNLIL